MIDITAHAEAILRAAMPNPEMVFDDRNCPVYARQPDQGCAGKFGGRIVFDEVQS